MDSEESVGVRLAPNSDKSSRRRTSFVWDYFTISPTDIRKAVCNNCGSEIVRGKDPRSFGTTSLASHIKYCYRSAVEGDPVRRLKRKRQPDLANEGGGGVATFSLSTDDMSMYVYPSDEPAPTDDIICSRKMDLIHSSHLMNILYEQHKTGKFCDLTLISAPIIDVRPRIPHPSDATLLTTERKGNKKEFRAHSSILAAVSAKIKTPIEMGSRTIELKDVSAFGLKSLLEIVYTGKLKRKKPLRYIEAHQVWKAASDLGVKFVHNYLVREHPQVAKWITDEERRPVSRPIDSYIYEITDDRENDLVDLCPGSPTSNDAEQNEQELSQKIGDTVDESFGDLDGQGSEEETKQEIEVKEDDDGSMVEITFDKT